MIVEPMVAEYNTDSKPLIPLRHWQRDLITAWGTWIYGRKKGDWKTFVAAVAGGAGKTYGGAFIAKECELLRSVDRVIVVCPSNTIVDQWLSTLKTVGLKRETVKWDGTYETGVTKGQNIVTTYAMMSNYPHRLKRAIGPDTLLIFDECHHLADSAMWGNAAREVAESAAYRLMLTATAFREDDAKIPLVKYQGGLLETNFEYSYGEALDDGHVRPTYFKALDADSRWKLDDNLANARLLEDDISTIAAQKALNAAINPNSDFMQELIGMAHRQLEVIRSRPESDDAAGIITCKDQAHARQVQRIVQKITHTNPVLSISDDPDSDGKIDQFRFSKDVWLIVVRKGSEGLNIPRLRVGIYATNILTELYFLQFFYRLVRQQQPGKKEDAYLFMPAHPKLLEYAKNIREMRIHALNEPVIDSPVSERTSAENGHGTTTPIASEPGSLVHIDIDANSSPLEKLIRIREQAAYAIDQAALDNGNQGNSSSHNTFVVDALKHIAEMLGAYGNTPLAPEKPELSAAQQFERKRQWKTFVHLYQELHAAPSWNHDVLSILWGQSDNSHTIQAVLRRVPHVPRSHFTHNRERIKLIELGLIKYEAGEFYISADELLSEICPDYDTELLIGYLLTGLPEES